MEKEICISEVKRIYAELKNIVNIPNVYFFIVEIFGNRWSFIKGDIGNDIPVSPPKKFDIGKKYAIVFYGWDNISDDKKKTIINIIQRKELKNV